MTQINLAFENVYDGIKSTLIEMKNSPMSSDFANFILPKIEVIWEAPFDYIDPYQKKQKSRNDGYSKP